MRTHLQSAGRRGATKAITVSLLSHSFTDKLVSVSSQCANIGSRTGPKCVVMGSVKPGCEMSCDNVIVRSAVDTSSTWSAKAAFTTTSGIAALREAVASVHPMSAQNRAEAAARSNEKGDVLGLTAFVSVDGPASGAMSMSASMSAISVLPTFRAVG